MTIHAVIDTKCLGVIIVEKKQESRYSPLG